MSLEETINADIKTAMLAKNEVALRSLRAIKAALIIAKTDKGSSGTIDADGEMKLLQKLVKQRKESAEIYIGQNRQDLAKPELEEIEIIEKFLPKQLSEDQIKSELMSLIANLGVTNAAGMGKVMGAASKHFAGKADNKLVSQLVKSLLPA